MAQAHAVQKGTVGLEQGDEGHKEMIDAPMVKQVALRSINLFVRLTFHYSGGEDNPNGACCRSSYPNTALRGPGLSR